MIRSVCRTSPPCRLVVAMVVASAIAFLMLGILPCQSLAQNEPTRSPEQPTRTTNQDAPPPLSREQIVALHEQGVARFQDGEYDAALDIWRQILKANPKDTIALYNAACTQARLSYPDKAVALLERAILAGFVDFDDMKRDPDLESIREHPRYVALVGAIDEAIALAGETMEQRAREMLDDDATVDRDERLRFVYATSLEPASHAIMRKTIDRQLDWQIEHLFDAAPDSWVLVIVPTPEKANEILRSARVGGYYDHDLRRLVTREIGPSLRHELTHALHHAQMDRLGQSHPMWLQEGLASVFELYELQDDGTLTVLPNSRMNIAVNLAKINGLSRWSRLFKEDDRRFTRNRPRAKYAETRAIFEFLAAHGRLVSWYRTYLETYDEDRGGALAFEREFDAPLDEVEQMFRAWVRDHDKVAEEIAADQPALGLWLSDQLANDGVRVVGVNPGGEARSAGVRPNDVILSIDGRPMYATEEIVYEIGRRDAGDEVTIRLRRIAKEYDVKVKLRPVTPPRDIDTAVSAPGVAV